VSLRDLEELGHLTIPKISSLKVRRYPFSKTSPWCITGLRNKDGKRPRLFFKTKPDATVEAGRIKVKFRAAGEKALEVTDELRLAALKCARRLVPYGKTIVDATDHYIRYLEDSQRSCTVTQLRDEFLESQRKARRSVVTPKEAERYWNIFPAKKPENVVPMTVSCSRRVRLEKILPWCCRAGAQW
jgi:hypothetical protein